MSQNSEKLSRGDFVYPNEKLIPISSEDNRVHIPKKRLLRIKTIQKGMGKDPIVLLTFEDVRGIWDSNYFVPVQKSQVHHVTD